MNKSELPEEPGGRSDLSIGPRAAAFTPTMKDDTFYFKDTVFLVENKLFKVPNLYFLAESEFFRLRAQQEAGSTNVEGSSEDHPLVVGGILASEFKALLRLMFPADLTSIRDGSMSHSDWVGILKFSHKWQMAGLKSRTVGKLSSWPSNEPIKAILAAREYDVPEWILVGYSRLVRRSQPLKPDEAKKLGIDVAMKICAIRECCVPPGKESKDWDLRKSRDEVKKLTIEERVKAEFNIK